AATPPAAALELRDGAGDGFARSLGVAADVRAAISFVDKFCNLAIRCFSVSVAMAASGTASRSEASDRVIPSAEDDGRPGAGLRRDAVGLECHKKAIERDMGQSGRKASVRRHRRAQAGSPMLRSIRPKQVTKKSELRQVVQIPPPRRWNTCLTAG